MTICGKHGSVGSSCPLCYDELKARYDELEKRSRACPRCESDRKMRESERQCRESIWKVKGVKPRKCLSGKNHKWETRIPPTGIVNSYAVCKVCGTRKAKP